MRSTVGLVICTRGPGVICRDLAIVFGSTGGGAEGVERAVPSAPGRREAAGFVTLTGERRAGLRGMGRWVPSSVVPVRTGGVGGAVGDRLSDRALADELGQLVRGLALWPSWPGWFTWPS